MNTKIKLGGVVVLYNPEDNIYDNIITYSPIVDHLYICDNSDIKNEELLRKLKNNDKITIIDMNGNQGIAKALKIGTKKCLESDFDFCLTMDQDSIFPIDKIEDIKKILSIENIDEYGIIALNYNKSNTVDGTELIDTKIWITSGNFINLKNYKLIDGFKEELFIDLVDFELCEQFNKIGKKIGYISNISLNHRLGDPIKKRFLFLKFTCTNHSPLRLYYRYRNTYYLYHKNKQFYRDLYKHEFHIVKYKILFFEDNKFQKLKMMKKGVTDAKKSILGKYKGL